MSNNKSVQRQRPGRLSVADEELHVGDSQHRQQEQQPVVHDKHNPEGLEGGPAPENTPHVHSESEAQPLSLGSPEEVRKAWEQSVISARTESRRWVAYSITLPEELWARLEARTAADQARYKLSSVAMSHYINAALSLIPRSSKAAAAQADEHAKGYGLVPPVFRPSGTRVHSDVQDRMRRLRPQLRKHARPGLLGHLQTAAVTALLDSLDAEQKAK